MWISLTFTPSPVYAKIKHSTKQTISKRQKPDRIEVRPKASRKSHAPESSPRLPVGKEAKTDISGVLTVTPRIYPCLNTPTHMRQHMSHVASQHISWDVPVNEYPRVIVHSRHRSNFILGRWSRQVACPLHHFSAPRPTSTCTSTHKDVHTGPFQWLTTPVTHKVATPTSRYGSIIHGHLKFIFAV